MTCAVEPRRGILAVTLCVAVAAASLIGSHLLPHWWQHSERQVAAAAFEYLEDIRAAQQQFFVENGRYATSIDDLDVRMPPPLHFSVAVIRSDLEQRDAPCWSLTLRRSGTPFGQRSYAVTYSDRGYEPARSSISAGLAPDRLPLTLVDSRSGDPQ